MIEHSSRGSLETTTRVVWFEGIFPDARLFFLPFTHERAILKIKSNRGITSHELYIECYVGDIQSKRVNIEIKNRNRTSSVWEGNKRDIVKRIKESLLKEDTEAR